jgi:surface polysaccharide O-acyltransferase-like enzyme
MLKSDRRAGQNIRELALKRRVKAVMSFVAAVLVVCVPILWMKASGYLLKQLVPNSSSQAKSSLEMPVIFYVMLVVIALGLVVNGMDLWKRAKNADQGAKGEEVTSRELSQLSNSKFRF